MYVRLAFAVAAHLEPEILVVDEVLAVGDAAFQKKCLGKMGDVATKEGRTVLFVSHNMGAILNLCKEGIYIESGNLKLKTRITNAIEMYISEKKTQSHDLLTYKNRQGNGNVRFSEISFKNNKKDLISQAISGETLLIELKFQSSELNKNKLSNCRVCTAFYDSLGQILFNCSTEFIHENSIDLPTRGKVTCMIPKLPLTQGRYLLSLFFEANKIIEDRLFQEIYIDVIDGDFYGTGKSYSQGWQGKGVLVNHLWKFE
jgi:lipopolysaccharide transport system ATP-binding protein